MEILKVLCDWKFADTPAVHFCFWLCPEWISIAKRSQQHPGRECAQIYYLNDHAFPYFRSLAELRILDLGKFITFVCLDKVERTTTTNTEFEMLLPGSAGGPALPEHITKPCNRMAVPEATLPTGGG